MKLLSVFMGITQGMLMLVGSALASEGSNSLFALNKISGMTETMVVGLSDTELARVEGSTVPRFPGTLTSRSNRIQQTNSAIVRQGGGSQETRLTQENRLTQTDGKISGGDRSLGSQIIATLSAIKETLPWFNQPTAPGSDHVTVTATVNQGGQAVITAANEGKTITVVVSQTSKQAVQNAQPVQLQASSIPRIDQGANIIIPPLPSSVNIGVSTSGVGAGFAQAVSQVRF
jgi:hypothetical protein